MRACSTIGAASRCVWLAAALLAALSLASAHAQTQSAQPKPDAAIKMPGNRDWDRAANIESAAKRLSELHRAKGSEFVLKFLNDCYLTHTIASKYTEGLEACIAQDYIHTQALVVVYSRLPKEAYEKLKAPTPHLLADSMGRRIATAFTKYKVSVAEAEAFKKLVDKHGLPIFFASVFPRASGQQQTKPKIPEVR